MSGGGKLRIYLGAAPGVGKTYAMLGEAHRRAARGTDIVVGLVETHDRLGTGALLDGLEVLPRRELTQREVKLTELDVDAVLSRRPAVVVVDELAHTNAPGSRHPKRWQDVEDILAAGITVLTTLNLQHLESLGDVVERITGARERDTIPDEVVRRADQVELIDITPEALRRRLAHGNVYPPERVDAAMANYFQPHNLAALRELALLWVADQVEVALQRYRADERVTGVRAAAGDVTRAVPDPGHVDEHRPTHAKAGRGLRLPRPSSALPLPRRALGWALALALPLLVSALGTLGKGVVGLSTDVVLFFLATVVVALVGGLGPALLAACWGGLLLTFFLTPPLHTFTISGRENVITLVVMVVVAVLVALVVDGAARRAQQAADARAEAALLASFSRTVLTGPDPLPRLLERVREAFGLGTVAVLQRSAGRWEVSACSGPPDCARPEQADVDVAVEPDVHLVVRGHALPAADRRLLEAVAGQALLALRNQQIAGEAAEARRRADATELRTALLSAVGHDLRTPLASIKAAAGGLRDPDLPLSDDDRADLAVTIDESADRLTRVVNNLLDSSRIATGAIAPALRPVGYDEIAAHAVGGLDPGIDVRDVRFEIDERLPEVLADPGLLERVIANIVDNALRHAAGAPVALRASSHADVVELRVVDQGRGVPADRADRLFTPFQRLGDRTHQGLGLGLSVARGFTEAMGGTLTAEDTPGGGLTVVISLPAAELPGPAVPMTRVLVVDDDVQLLRALRINLTARGYDVHTACDGRSALRAAAEQPPDVIVLDLGLPDLDGTEVITELRSFSTVPIVVLSARTDSTDKVHALDRGADDYVTKPFGVEELTARLRAAVRRAATPAPTDGAVVEAGDLTIDLAARIVQRQGQDVHLTPTEWSILDLLVRNHGRLVGRQQLLTHIWGPAERKDTSYLRVYLAQLRRKLEHDPARPEHLITEAGAGYRFRS